jgi:cobyrinic acid a,c-diamide synthase
MTDTRHCPALFLAAPASGQGKTTLVAGLARYHSARGRRVRVFKTGPDFLDPMILARACGEPVAPLDLWMVGESGCRTKLYAAAGEADLILIEGVMGLFDGTPSGADLAERFGVPVAALIDARAMAQTFGALAFGLARFRPSLAFAGVIANRVGSERHAGMLRASLPPDIPFLGALPRIAEASIPSRHLGLVQADEILDLDARLDATAQAIGATELARLPAPVAFVASDEVANLPRLLAGRRIAVARDAAFSFVYPDNLALLQSMGAELIEFSPLGDERVEADAIYLPGGYPELHLRELEDNAAMRAALQSHVAAGRPIHAECGGLLYLLESLTDQYGERGRMVGLLPGHARMQQRLAGLGMQSIELPQGVLRGHSFHHSVTETPLVPAGYGVHHPDGARGEPFYRQGAVRASYLHPYFPSAPEASAALFLP